MSIFWKLVAETQMSKSPEATGHHNSTKNWSFYSSEPFSFVHFNMIHPVLVMYLCKNIQRTHLMMNIACCLPTYFKHRAAIKIDTKECFSILIFCICKYSQKAGLHKSKFTYLPLLYIERCASIYCSMPTINCWAQNTHT